MFGTSNIHTDLALEDKERFEAEQVEISGVSVEEFFDEEYGILTTEVKILTENGAKAMRKPVGTYITIEMSNLVLEDEEYHKEVLGLGNREVTPDALGPCAVEQLNITRHIIKEYGSCALENTTQMVSAIAPGVMAQTGMEAHEIIKGVTNVVHPDVVFVIDALAARNTKRLNRTIQITDTGIRPGSGVGNHRNEISEVTLGVPVIAIGVPTVVDAATIVRDTMENILSTMEKEEQYNFMEDIIAPHLYGMFVTPKDIDEAIDVIGSTIADGLNILFQKEI